MRPSYINSRSLAQRARRDAEREANPRHGPPIIPAGTVVGHVELCLHGRTVRCDLIQIDGKAQTHRLRIGAESLGNGGAYQAWRAVSQRVGRMPGKRNDVWNDDA